MNQNTKARILIIFGNSVTVLAILLIGYLIWNQELQSILIQYQAKQEFVSKLPTPTALPTSTTAPSSETVTPTIIPVFTATTTITPTSIPKTSFLLEIPYVGISWMVHHITPDEITDTENWGIKKSLLDQYGVVDYPHLQYPGELGLTAVVGHSNVSGNPFWYLGRVIPDTKIKITLLDGTLYEYLVYQALVVDPDDKIFWETKYPRELRLVSCLTNSTAKRVMIFAYQIQP